MESKAKSDTLDRLDQAARAAEALSGVLSGHPEFASLKITQVLKLDETRQVFQARLNGEKVAIKRFLGSTATEMARGAQTELDYMAPRMGQGSLRLNRCLHALPDLGVVVLSFVPGRRLNDILTTANRGKRRRLLRQSGQWLAAYTQPRQRLAKFGPGHWIQRRMELDTTVLYPKDKALLKELLSALRGQAQATAGHPVKQAATHADFVPLNLHFHRGTLYGVDVQGERWMAIARDVARFLAWLPVYLPTEGEATLHGIAQVDRDALLACGILDADQQATTLPFFIGEQLYFRFVTAYGNLTHRQHARRAIVHYLEDCT